MIYMDENGAIYRVDQGLGKGEWMTLRRKRGKEGSHRVKSPALPLRAISVEAQADLDVWAEKKGLKPVGLGIFSMGRAERPF
jgi:hypothetical protein